MDELKERRNERRIAERTKIVLSVRVTHPPAGDYANGFLKSDVMFADKPSYDSSSFELEGSTVNVSNSGACVVLNGSLFVNAEIYIYIESEPDYRQSIDEKERFKIRARIVRVEKSLRDERRYRYGISFLNLENKENPVINRILSFEQKNLSDSIGKNSHPSTNFPSLPFSSKILDDICPTALSVDVTNLCNLKCKHCFWDSYSCEVAAITNRSILESVKRVLEKYPSITNITWYGGEPLLNKETISLVEKGMKLRKNNLVITNGTSPIPDWHKDIHIGVSVDGVREIHNELRELEIYDKLKTNIISAINKRVPVGILYCLNAVNVDCIPEFLEEWSQVGLIEIVFTTYAPIKGRHPVLALTDTQRDKAVSILLEMKGKYKNLISNTEAMIELILGKYGKVLADNCLMNIFNRKSRVYSIHMCNDGSIRVPCALGRDADCLECRSVTKLALYAGMVLRDKKTLFALFKMYHSKPHRMEAETSTV